MRDRLLDTHQLSNKESTNKHESRAFDERPAPGSGDKDECLAHNTHLEIQSCCQLINVIPDRMNMEVPLYRFQSKDIDQIQNAKT